MNCPIEDDTRQIILTGEQMVRAMRKLRRDLASCRRCARAKNCALRVSFRAMVDAAIDEVNEEWGLSHER
jgi:hypothetical protein